MVKEKIYLGKWGSDRAEAKFRAKEEVLWKRARRQPEAIDIPTGFGSTRVYRWQGSGAPVVFLHGMTDTSVRWIPYADSLTGNDVYAIDIMGDVGRSKPDVGFTSATDYAVWLEEVLAALDLDRPHLVGASLGGFIALSHSVQFNTGQSNTGQSNRIGSVVGLDPVGVVKLKLGKVIMAGMRVAFASFLPLSMRRRLAKTLRQPLLADNESLAVLMQAQRGHPIKVPPCPEFTDEELRAITVPVSVLSGEKSVAFNAQQLVGRINEFVPGGSARMIPDAGHALSDSQFEECLATIREAVAARV